MIKPGMLISERYEIIEKVGSGGMADVYKAKCHRLNRYVAIKVLKSEFSSDRSFVNKFRGEAQSAAGLSHPNIVNVYDVGDDDGLHYIVMELVEGITLKKFIERKGKLEVKEAIGIAIQIAQGMEAAHANHIIHRDIKPQNIIISKEGKVKVTDFGIAKATTSNTITSNAMGSVHYLSPEQARGGYSDEKSDIYSLGVTMYEMLSGQVPFAGDNNVSVALAHIQGEAVPLSVINPDIPHGVDMIVQKCMQKKPERRYLTASELIADLKKAIANPNGDFVKLAVPVAMDSPTINLSSEELERINQGTGVSTDYNRKPVEAEDDSYIEDDEDDDIDAVDPRLTKILIGFSIPVAIATIVLIVFGVSRVMTSLKPENSNNTNTEGNPLEDPMTITPSVTPEVNEDEEKLTMINVIDMTKEQAETALKQLSPAFQIVYLDNEYSDTIDKGNIMEQTPNANTQIEKDATITLRVSLGGESFKLDDYVGKPFEEVQKAMEDLGLVVTKKDTYDENIIDGNVVSTIPEAGSDVNKGTEVVVMVSKGSEQVSVPNLMNMTEEDALKAISDAGLTVGDIARSSSNEYPEGVVKYQSYSYGEKVKPGTVIDIAISTGQEPTPTPTEEPTPTPTEEPTQVPTEKPTEEPTEEPTQAPEEEDPTYYGRIEIKESPFTGDKESGYVIIELEQDGSFTAVAEGEMDSSDFPLVKNIESSSSSEGTIRMYIDSHLYTDETWQVRFSE